MIIRMRLITRFLASCSLIVLISGVTIHEECEPKKVFDLKWHGTKADVTFWLPEEYPEGKDYALLFILQFRDHPRRDTKDQIKLMTSRANLLKIRNRVETNKTFEFPGVLLAGWNTLTFSSTPHIEVTHNGTTILDYDPGQELTIEEVGISGTDMVINCYHSSLLWHAGQRINVPLPPMELKHNLSLFSNIPTKPVFRLDSSNAIQLGWDGEGLADYTDFKVEKQTPIPASVEHWLTVSCRETENIICVFKDGRKGTSITTLKLKNLPKEFTIWTQEANDLLVFYHQQKINRGLGLENVPVVKDMDAKESLKEDGNNPWITVAIILLITLIASLAFISYLKCWKKLRKPKCPEKAEELAELNPLLPGIRILKSIDDGDYLTIEDVLKEIPVKDEYRIRAHYSGQKKILNLFRQKDQPECQPSDDIIKQVYKILETGMKEVFVAAENGFYFEMLNLLRKHNLPKSVTDHQGYSILHYMVKFKDGKPVWTRKDMEDFLACQDYFINAIDYKGNTALHHLARYFSEDSEVCWGDNELRIGEVKKIIADMLLHKGADPNIKNYESKKPQNLAGEFANLELQKQLEKSASPSTKFGIKNGFDGFQDLVKAARGGQTRQLCEMLNNGVPVLPVYAREDPLVEAARNNHREAFFLLLSAGASICNRSIEDQTPLDATHNTLGLPACYAAVVRKAFCDRLTLEKEEAKKIRGMDTNSRSILYKIIDEYILSIKDKGKEVKEIVLNHRKESDRESYSKEIRVLLSEAAREGLSLTCLLLGQKDVYLHPLPGDPSLFCEDIWTKHYDTQLVLCRDLSVLPFREGTKTQHIELLRDMYYGESKILDEQLEKNKETYNIHNDMINSLKAYDGDLKGEISKDLLIFLTRFNLVVHLDKIFNITNNFDVNQIVEEFSGSTMLHLAAMHGNIRTVEYLIYKQASLNPLTAGGFSVAHLAAIGGHKECFQYIKAWMNKMNKNKVDIKCNIGLTAQELMSKYEELCGRSAQPLLTQEDALVIKNATTHDLKTYEILSRKGKIKGINNFNSLRKFVEDETREKSEEEDVISLVKASTEGLMANGSASINGNFVPIGPLEEGNELLDITHYDFVFEVQVDLNKEDAIEMLTKKFPKCIEDAVKQYKEESNKISLAQYKEESNKISLAPPFITRAPKGVYIRWVFYDQAKLKLLTSYIVPIIKFADNEETHFQFNRREDKLIPFSYKEDVEPFKCLSETDRSAWLICRMLRKLTQECWWSPTFDNQFYSEDWHTWSLGVKGLSETTHKKLFKEKISNTENMYEKLFSSFESIVEKKEGKWVPKKSITCTTIEKLYVCGILRYLESLGKPSI